MRCCVGNLRESSSSESSLSHGKLVLRAEGGLFFAVHVSVENDTLFLIVKTICGGLYLSFVISSLEHLLQEMRCFDLLAEMVA